MKEKLSLSIMIKRRKDGVSFRFSSWWYDQVGQYSESVQDFHSACIEDFRVPKLYVFPTHHTLERKISFLLSTVCPSLYAKSYRSNNIRAKIRSLRKIYKIILCKIKLFQHLQLLNIPKYGGQNLKFWHSKILKSKCPSIRKILNIETCLSVNHRYFSERIYNWQS